MKWILYAALAAGIVTTPAGADDWPRWRGPNLNGISREKTWSTNWLKEGPPRLWKAEVGIGFSSVSVGSGRLYTMGNRDETDTVFCFDAGTGKEIWKHSYPCALDPKYYEGGPGATPTIDGDRIYTLSKRGHLHAYEAKSGKVLWQRNLLEELGVKKPDWGFASSPLLQGDFVIVNVGSAGTAVHKETGKVVWLSGTDLAGYATAVPYGSGEEKTLAIFSGKAVVGVKWEDGKEIWRYPWIERWNINAADPIFVDDKLFISTFGKGCALLNIRGSTPTVIWENKNMGNHFNGCVFYEGHIYGIHGNTDEAYKDLRCLDFATGEVKWKQTGFGLGSVTIADGKLIVLSERGELVVAPVSAKGFEPVARAQVLGGKCWTVPVLAHGRIYCRNAQGTLVCLDVARN